MAGAMYRYFSPFPATAEGVTGRKTKTILSRKITAMLQWIPPHNYGHTAIPPNDYCQHYCPYGRQSITAVWHDPPFFVTRWESSGVY